MKKLFYGLAITIMSATASYAQKAPKMTAEQKAEKFAVEMQQVANLTDDQKAKVQAIQLERLNKGAEWKAATTPVTDEDKKSFHQQIKEKMNAVLTPEQKKIWSEAKRKERGTKQKEEQ